MTFLEECIAFSAPVWGRLQQHPWIEALFAGSLSEERFNYWLAQNLSYLDDHSLSIAMTRVPPHSRWRQLQLEYMANGSSTRVERRLIEEPSPFATSRWAARPAREAFIDSWCRVFYEGSFGDVCAAIYVCFSFCDTFGKRYLRERPKGLSPMQVEWVEQFTRPDYEERRQPTEDGLNEYGAAGTEYEREKMRWIFLRSTQHQVATFDAAWKASDPWPGEDEQGVLAYPPNCGPAADGR